MSRTCPLVCSVQSWHLFSRGRVLPNADGSLTVKIKIVVFSSLRLITLHKSNEK